MEKTTSTALKFILKRPEDQSGTGDTGNNSGNTGDTGDTGNNQGGNNSSNTGDSSGNNTGNNQGGNNSSNTGNNSNTGGSNGDGSSNISPPTNDTTGNSNTSSSNSSTSTLTGTTTSYQSTGSTAYTAGTSTIAVPNTGENSAAGAANGSRSNSAFTPIFASLFLIAAVAIIVKTAIKQKKFHRNFSGGVSKFGFRPLQISLVGSSTLALAFLGFSLISHAQSEDKAEAASSMISISTLGTVEKEMKDHFDLDKLIYVTKDVVSINSSSSNYHLFMHAASDKLYLNGDNTSSNYFRPVEGSSDYNANFQDGSWGFHTVQGFLDGCTSDTEEVDLPNCAAVSWNAMPTTATEIVGFSAVQPSTGSFSSNTEVYFAANPSDNLAHGTYSTEIIYTAIADEVPDPENPNPPSGDTPTVVHSMQDVNINDLPAGQTSTVSDARDGQEYTVYRWPATGTAGTDYPEGMAGYAIMTEDLALGYVTGGSITKDADLTLTTDNSASAGTITAGTDASNWSATYINNDEYKHPYYSYAAAQMVCPKGWHLPSEREYNLIGLFMERIHEGAITEAPYKFYPSGYFKPSDGLQDDFFHGYYWSSTQNNVLKSSGEYLKFAWDNNPGITNASKSYSMSVRCLKGVYMQDVKDGDLNTSARSVLVDKRDNQAYEVYRWPTTGTAGTDYPTDMAGYAIMVNDLSLGYNTGGFVTADADLVLSVADSAGVGTISFRADNSAWSTTNNDENLQYTNGPVTNKYDYSSHSYYSFSAAQIACPKGWRLPTKVEYDNIVTFMKAGGSAANGSATIQDSPYNFLYGGLFNNNGFNNNVGTTGQYWASVQYNASNGYHLNFTSSAIATGNAAKQTGQSVRCIAESSSTEPTTIADCSSTVHPTADTPCKMADNRAWILGNNGATITWNDAFSGATNADGHDATVKFGICPEGYSAPKITDFDILLQAYGAEPFTSTAGLREGYKETANAMLNVLGANGDYWSSTELDENNAFTLFVSDSNNARDTGVGTKTNANKILCYK